MPLDQRTRTRSRGRIAPASDEPKLEGRGFDCGEELNAKPGGGVGGGGGGDGRASCHVLV